MPPALPLTSERMERHGLFMIEDGQTIFLWVGRDAVPQLIMDVFNLQSYEVLRGGKVSCSFPSQVHLIQRFTYAVCTDDASSTRQPVLTARQCGDPKDAGDATGTILPTPVCGERGRGATTAFVGFERVDPGQGGRLAELPTVYSAVEGQG